MQMRLVAVFTCLAALAGCQKNRPPLVASIMAPTIAQRGDSVWIELYSLDPDGDSLSLLTDWADGSDPAWVGPMPSGSDCRLAHVYGDTGVFGIRAKARDAENESDWSEACTVHVGEYGPGIPRRPTGPDTVAIGDSATYRTSAAHPLGKSVAFQFDWGDTVGDWGEFVAAGEFYSTPHAFSRGGTMAVRARARDTLEHVSDWSGPETVFVIDTFRFR
jgi:hypothetical protein